MRRCKVGMQDKLQTSSLPDMYNTDRILNPSRPILPALSCPVTSPNFEPQEACTSALSLSLFVYMPNPAFRVSLFLQPAATDLACMYWISPDSTLFMRCVTIFDYQSTTSLPFLHTLHYTTALLQVGRTAGYACWLGFRSVPDMSLVGRVAIW